MEWTPSEKRKADGIDQSRTEAKLGTDKKRVIVSVLLFSAGTQKSLKDKKDASAMSSVPVITTTPLPPLTISGVLPPYLGTDPAKPGAMSPYKTTVLDVATRFCYSDQRRIIFNGLLNYRQRLHLLGLSDGFQWLCGSFMEDIETLEGRPPQDIDVITFYYQPAALRGDPAGWTALATGNSALFEPSATKTNFHCDAYFIDLEMPGTWIAEQTKYWFGLFSHRRGGLWKGLAQVPLAITSADALASTRIAGGTP